LDDVIARSAIDQQHGQRQEMILCLRTSNDLEFALLSLPERAFTGSWIWVLKEANDASF